MSIIANTFATYEAKGIRENLTDLISNISPEDTPFMSSIKRSKAEQVLHEWQTDSLAAAVSNNQVLEGDDIASFDAASPTSRIGNYCQIARKTLVLSGTLEVVNKAGRKSELAYQISKKSAELKRDMETNFLSNTGAVAGADATIRKAGSLLAFIKTNSNKGAAGADPTWTTVPTGTRTDGTQRDFSEVILKDVVQKVWTSGGNASVLSLGAVEKQLASTFAGIATATYAMSTPKVSAILGAADIYITDFGKLSIVANRFQRSRDALFIDPSRASVAYLRPYFVKALAATGDAEKRALLVEYTLRVDNEAAFGIAADLN